MQRERPQKTAREALEANIAKDAATIKSRLGARDFVSRWGVDNCKPYLTEDLWLDAYLLVSNTPEKSMIADILHSRGAEKTALAAITKEKGIALIEIFGLDAHTLLSSEISSLVKGRHLEDQLGL